MNHEDIATISSRAWRALRDGNPAQAVEAFEQALRLQNDDIDACYGMGLAQRNAGSPAKAVEYFQRAASLLDRQSAAGGDRFLMLSRIIRQRLAELGAVPAPPAPL